MKVKVVARQGAAALVEWVEDCPYGGPAYKRAIVPASEARARPGESVELANPDHGVPGGEPWEDLLMEGGVAERIAWEIANELRRLGIWGVADLQARPRDAVAAFQRGYNMDVQRLRARAERAPAAQSR